MKGKYCLEHYFESGDCSSYGYCGCSRNKLVHRGMRVINLIVVHCSATKADRDFTEQDLEVCHRRRGMNGPGYHFYIRKNGDIKTTRPIEKIGAHARGYNAQSIGICYEGGGRASGGGGRAGSTRDGWWRETILLSCTGRGRLLVDYPGCKVCGHRDLSPDLNGNGEIEPEEVGETVSLF